MRADRLLTLADFLETVPGEKFDMSIWWCESKACALGWACTIPEFQLAGLYMMQIYPKYGYPTYKDRHSLGAAEEFFEIDRSQASHLFSSSSSTSDTTPRDVAELIRKFVKENTHAR